MYKVYVDKVLFSREKAWKNIANDEKYEVISYSGFDDLILKLDLENDNIIYLVDYSTANDCYEKTRVLKGKFSFSALNVVANGIKLEVKHLNRVGVNAIVRANNVEEINESLKTSSELVDAYKDDQYIYVNKDTEHPNVDVVTVIGATGGVGKTTVAVNLAAAYAEFGLKTCLVDFSLQFGDVSLFTSVKPNFTVYDLLMTASDLTPNLNLFLDHVNPNLFVLPAPVLPEQADYITRPMVAELINNLADSFDVLVFDTPSIVNDLCLELYRLSDQLVMVTTKDLQSIKNAKLQYDILEKLEVADKIKLVINKCDSPKFVVDNKSVTKLLGIEAVANVPHSNAVVVNSINMGQPFVIAYPKEEISDSIRELMSNTRLNVAKENGNEAK